jgi:hypothetical protein
MLHTTTTLQPNQTNRLFHKHTQAEKSRLANQAIAAPRWAIPPIAARARQLQHTTPEPDANPHHVLAPASFSALAASR